MTVCKYPGCDYDVSDHRPYAKARDRLPSVSAIAGLLDDGKSRSFAWAASLIAAVTAVHKPDEWDGFGADSCTHKKDGLCPACRYLRSAHDREWRAKADLGTHVHHMAASWSAGEEVDEDDVTAPYLDALAAFYDERKPEWQITEACVLNDRQPHRYRGQFDWIATIECPAPGHLGRRCRWLGDWKSGGFYPIEQTLQLAGYRYAEHLTDWSDGTETVVGPVPTVDHAGVCLLGGDGHYRLIELPATRDTHGTFLRLVDIHNWHQQTKKWIKDNRIGEEPE